jgi:hypothetical protein
MKLFMVFIISVVLSLPNPGLAQSEKKSTRLKDFIDRYPELALQQKELELLELRKALGKHATRYDIYYRNFRSDPGFANPYLFKIQGIRNRVTEDAINFAEGYIEASPEEMNTLTFELMHRYLFEPDSRPAIYKIVEALKAVKFTEAYEQKLEDNKDPIIVGSEGFVYGVGALAATVCAFRLSHCARVLKEFARATQESARELYRSAARAGLASRLRKAVGYSLGGARRALGGTRSFTVGGIAAKLSLYARYSALNARRRLPDFLTVISAGGVGSVATWKIQEHFNRLNEGRFDKSLIDPFEQEQKYFGALGLLQLRCQMYEKSDELSALRKEKKPIPLNELRDFILSAHEEILFYGVAASGRAYATQVELPFVTPVAGGLKVELDLFKDRPESFVIPCKDSFKFGSPPIASVIGIEPLLEFFVDLYYREKVMQDQASKASKLSGNAQIAPKKGVAN